MKPKEPEPKDDEDDDDDKSAIILQLGEIRICSHRKKDTLQNCEKLIKSLISDKKIKGYLHNLETKKLISLSQYLG